MTKLKTTYDLISRTIPSIDIFLGNVTGGGQCFLQLLDQPKPARIAALSVSLPRDISGNGNFNLQSSYRNSILL